MELIPLSVSESIEIFSVDLQTLPNELAELTAVLSQDEIVRVQRFHSSVVRDRFIKTRAALRQTLGMHLKVDAKSVRFSYGKLGKPDVQCRPEENLFFSVSHCNDKAIIAISKYRRIGVDVECVRQVPDALEMARFIFNETELKKLNGLSTDRLSSDFLSYWVRKEALVKALGEGVDFFREFALVHEPENEEILKIKNPGEDKVSNWSISHFRPAADYLAALACEL